jgi:ABC-type multidrug transport system fused ATPase/permease subunit
MIQQWRRLLSLFLPKEQLQIYLLLVSAMIMALIQVVGIATVMPFIAVLLDERVIESNPYLQRAYDVFGFESLSHFKIFLGLLSLVTLVISNGFAAFEAWFTYRFCFTRTHSMCLRLLAKYLHQPYLAFAERSRAELEKIIVDDVDRVVVGTLMAGIGLFADVVSALFILLLLAFVDPIVTVSAVSVLGASYVGVHLLIRKRVSQLGEEFVTLTTAIVARTQEALENIKEIKVFRRENEFVRRLADPRQRFANNAIRHRTLDLVPIHLIEVISFGVIVVVALYYLLTRGTSSSALAIIALYTFAAYRLVPSLKAIFDGVDTIRYNAPALEVIWKDFDPQRQGRRGGDLGPPPPLQTGIQVENVSFTYPRARNPAAAGLTLHLPAGKLTCIMGPSGAGKSTAVDLILGLLHADSGRILIDGTPLDPSTVDQWRAALGYVPQVVNLVDDTVAGNIAFGPRGKDIDLARVERAARIAQIHDFVAELEHGYDTLVGEKGSRLSSGQRQRIGIARALYRLPPVLILDEGTNALDAETERRVIEALLELEPKRTILFVSHKATVAKRAAGIVIINEGRVLAEGPYADLVFDPRFRDLLTDT